MSHNPPNPDAGGGGSGTTPEQKIVVNDPEDFAKTRQLRSIFNARDDYIQARREANRKMEDGELDFADRNRRIFRHLQDLAMMMEPLLKSYDPGREIWDENTYGVNESFCDAAELASKEEAINYVSNRIEEDRPSNYVEELAKQYQKHRDSSEMGSLGKRKKVVARMRVYATSWGWEVHGLGTLIERTHKLRYKKSSSESEFGTTAPTQEVSDSAFSDLQDFIRQIGLGVQFNTEQQTKIDSDLLKEVDQWRRENVK